MYNNLEKICGFYVSKEHLVAMLVPYIYNSLKNECRIETFFEEDLEEILSKIKFGEEFEYQKLNDVDWKALRKSELSQKFESDNNILIVAGSKDFITRLNSIILNFHTNFTLVNCYDLNELNSNLLEVKEEYSKILSTKGIEEIEKLYTV